ncbi:MAG: hypothetical protein ACLQGV_01720 [Bryobacteraceae bacterium]
MTFDYESWIKQAQGRLELLHSQRAAIEDEIANLERGIAGFRPLVKSMWAGPDAGITASIRNVFKRQPDRIWTPPEIRDELLRIGVNLSQKNPLATIHQILDRLLRSGYIKPLVVDSRTSYLYAK